MAGGEVSSGPIRVKEPRLGCKRSAAGTTSTGHLFGSWELEEVSGWLECHPSTTAAYAVRKSADEPRYEAFGAGIGQNPPGSLSARVVSARPFPSPWLAPGLREKAPCFSVYAAVYPPSVAHGQCRADVIPKRLVEAALCPFASSRSRLAPGAPVRANCGASDVTRRPANLFDGSCPADEAAPISSCLRASRRVTLHPGLG